MSVKDASAGRAGWLADLGPVVAELRQWLRKLAGELFRDTARLSGSDLVQETLLDAAKCPDSVRYGTLAEKRAWLKTVLVRKVANALRDHSRAKRDVSRDRPLDAAAVVKYLANELACPQRQAERAEGAARVGAALDVLTEPQRQVVQLRYREGLPLDEIAARCGCSVPSVSRMLDRAKERLRDRLGED